MTDDAAVFLICSRQEARYINNVDEGNPEGIAEANEAGRLIGSIDIKTASHDTRLIGNDADRTSVQAGQTGNDIAGIHTMRFHIFTVIDDTANDLIHVVRHMGPIRNDGIE